MPAAPVTPDPDFFSLQITRARRFFAPPQHAPRNKLAVICAGLEHCAPDYHISRSTFPYLSIEFLARGHALLTINGKTHRLSSGALFAYGPGVPHDISADPDLPQPAPPLIKYFVGFLGSPAKRLLTPQPAHVLQTSDPDHLLRLFEDLISAGLRQSPFRDRILSVLGEHLLLRIAETAVPLGAADSPAFRTYQRCRRLIETHHLSLRGLDDIAARTRLAPAYICRLFRRFDHQSPWQFALRLKIQEAVSRLHEPHASVSSVAASLNFPDPFQFSRTFRRLLGLSPRQFLHPAK